MLHVIAWVLAGAFIIFAVVFGAVVLRSSKESQVEFQARMPGIIERTNAGHQHLLGRPARIDDDTGQFTALPRELPREPA